MIARHMDPLHNPLGLGLILDSGWRTEATFNDGFDGRPQVARPLIKSDLFAPENKDALERASANLVVFRQSNEHGNGGLKRAFPLLTEKVRFDDRHILERDMEMCVRLWNMRTRLVGWNQVNTTYMRHADDDFARCLATNNTVDGHVALRQGRFDTLLAADLV
jgi:hypothetical protein